MFYVVASAAQPSPVAVRVTLNTAATTRLPRRAKRWRRVWCGHGSSCRTNLDLPPLAERALGVICTLGALHPCIPHKQMRYRTNRKGQPREFWNTVQKSGTDESVSPIDSPMMVGLLVRKAHLQRHRPHQGQSAKTRSKNSQADIRIENEIISSLEKNIASTGVVVKATRSTGDAGSGAILTLLGNPNP